jgi:hypothetical protein
MELDNLISDVEESINGYMDIDPDNPMSLSIAADNMHWVLQMVEGYLLKLRDIRDYPEKNYED